MTDLEKQAREVLAAIVEEDDRRGGARPSSPLGKSTAYYIRDGQGASITAWQAIRAMLAFRAAQPGEGASEHLRQAREYILDGSTPGTLILAEIDAARALLSTPQRPERLDREEEACLGHNPLREALIMAAHLAPGVTRTGSEAERIADAVLPLFEGAEMVSTDREAVIEALRGKLKDGPLALRFQWTSPSKGALDEALAMLADAILALLPSEDGGREERDRLSKELAAAGRNVFELQAGNAVLVKQIEQLRAALRKIKTAAMLATEWLDRINDRDSTALGGPQWFELGRAIAKADEALSEPQEQGAGK